jgi:hypothetical protein
MAMRTARPGGWLATLTLSVGVLTLGGAVLHGRADEAKRPSGIYLESAETSGKDEPKRLETVMGQVNPEGLGASMATMGFKKPKMVTKISGEKSGIRVPAQSTFLFVFGARQSRGPSPNDDIAATMATMKDSMNQLPMTTSSPKDYVLVQLTVADGERVYNTGDAKPVKCAVENVEPKVFRIRPAAPLAPGEYGFTLAQQAAGMFWDFGVDGTATK